MSYKTKINDTTRKRREQLRHAIDDFATFKWRGHDMFEDFGAFIISEKLGDLKFYNGGSFSNEYSKPQFSPASGNLLGVTINKQQIIFKVGVYWFSSSEWQDFIECINPYEVNYLSFGYAPKYGYLVKLAKIADTPRYIVGHEDGEPRYYTEIQLDWDLQGENCVRSNLPYEWNYSNGNFTINGKQEANTTSKLPTPLVLQIPLKFTNNEDTTSIEAKCGNDQLFKIEFNSIPEINKPEPIFDYKFTFPDTIKFFESDNVTVVAQEYSVWFICGDNIYDKIIIDHSSQAILYYKGEEPTYAYIDNQWVENEYKTIYATSPLPIGIRSLCGEDYDYSDILNTDSFYKQNYYSNILTLQYDSETGILLYQVGDSKWRLLHLNLVDSNGNYIVKSFIANKYKLQGNLTNTTVSITYANCSAAADPVLQIYERTNVI